MSDSLGWAECGRQAELLLREVSEENPTAYTQLERQMLRDKILMAQAYATLAMARRG